jgi:2-dehydro-3-deoxygalactonokinase
MSGHDNKFLACDWGTTNLRAWLVGNRGEILLRRSFPYGVARLESGEAKKRFYEDVRPSMGADTMPAYLCGMIGSDLGWTEVPHQACPADLGTLARALVKTEETPGVWIVPGLLGTGISVYPDVMRGEETQILGWIAQDSSRACGRTLICHPGTHCKWAVIEDGFIVRFVTAMTGELFDILRSHSILRSDEPAGDEIAFDEGIAAAADGSALAARLFTTRTRVIAGMRRRQTSTSYLSGLLIAAEIASIPEFLGGTWDNAVNLLGDMELCRWYKRAFLQKGIEAAVFSGESAVISGLNALRERTVL